MRDTIPQYESLPGLSYKACSFARDDGRFSGIYLWKAIGQEASGDVALTPEYKPAQRQTAIACTQSVLMTLDRDECLAGLLDAVFHLSPEISRPSRRPRC